MNRPQVTPELIATVAATFCSINGPLPEPHLHTAALAVMNAGWERGGHVYSAAQMHAYASQEVAAALERFVEALADACMAAEIPDSKFESLLIALRA